MTITVKSQGETFTFPDGTSDAEIGESLDSFFASPESAPDLERGVFESALIGLGGGLTRAAQGVTQLGLAAGEAVGLVEEGRAAAVGEAARQEREFFAGTPVGQTTAGQVGQFAGEVLPALALGGVSVPGAIAAGAITGATQVQEDPAAAGLSQARLEEAVLGGTLGGAVSIIPILGRFIARKARESATALGGVTPTARSLEGITPTATAEARAAADRLDTFVTPAEAAGDEIALLREGSLEFTPTTQRKVLSRLNNREKVLQRELEGIYKGLVPEGVDDAIQTAVDLERVAFQRPVSEQAFDFLASQDEALAKAIKDARGGARNSLIRRSRAQGRELLPGTVGELHLVRMALDDTIEAAKRGGESIAGLSSSRKFLLELADAVSPEYALSRGINQRLILRNDILGTLNRAKVEDIEGSMNFFKRFLAKGKERDEFLRDIGNIKDDFVRVGTESKVKALEPLLRAVNRSTLAQAVGKRPISAELRARGVGGPRGVAANFVANIVGGTYDKAMVDFITDPNWSVEMLNRAVQGRTGLAKSTAIGEFFELIANRSAAIAATREE